MTTQNHCETILDRLNRVRTHIRQLALDAGKHADDIKLLAVSKLHPASSVLEAIHAGQFLFGENRVQEAQSKFKDLKTDWPGLRLHLIGALQTNKALEAVKLFDCIQSVDRPTLLAALKRAADHVGRVPDLLVQVNTGNEPQKAGINRDHAPVFVESCLQAFPNHVQGLMCIPPAKENPHGHFAYLASLAHSFDLPVISMGMSSDFSAAIADGATLIRIGTAIFGNRN